MKKSYKKYRNAMKAIVGHVANIEYEEDLPNLIRLFQLLKNFHEETEILSLLDIGISRARLEQALRPEDKA
jgi:hypothetical protein